MSIGKVTRVEKAISTLGTGFLKNKANTRLKEALQEGTLDKQEFYRQLLRLVYRLVFLFMAEERDVLLNPVSLETAKARYWKDHSVRRLRNLSSKKNQSMHEDMWKGLVLIMEKLNDGCADLALPALGTFLWKPDSCAWLVHSECSNEYLTDAIQALSYTVKDGQRYPINWSNIGVDELGAIYESLLELHPQINHEAGIFQLGSLAGNERKTTGSYYTPNSLVECVLDSTLDPVLHRATYGKPREEQEKNLLEITICDAACGLGHFLVAAARRLAKRLAQVRSGDVDPGLDVVLQAMRDVVSRCMYGVDINPMAVELCKVALWMEALEPGKPLSFFDSHIQCGNALLGTTPALMAKGIPDHAFAHLVGDETYEVTRKGKVRTVKLASDLRIRNRTERNQSSLPQRLIEKEHKAKQTSTSEEVWNNCHLSSGLKREKFLADMWCSAFVWHKRRGVPLKDGTGYDEHESITFAPTMGMWRIAEENIGSLPQYTCDRVNELAKEYQFFHWHVAFPHVFRKLEDLDDGEDHRGWDGGFTVMLGNPPWETLELKEKEFFASRNTMIANASKASIRKREIERLKDSLLALDTQHYQQYVHAKRTIDGTRHIISSAGMFDLCGRGRTNLYAVFTELNRNQISDDGRAGCIVPTGIAVDDTTKYFFQDLMKKKTLVSLFDFENKKEIFKGVHKSYRFCAITMSGLGSPNISGAQFCFFADHPDDIYNPEKRCTLTMEDIERINPNTGNCPIFHNVKDAALTKWVYGRVPVLWKEARENRAEQNPWRIRFRQGTHNMSSDSGYFRSKEQLERAGWILNGNAFERKGETYLPLMEAKLIHHYNHRFSTFNSAGSDSRNVDLSQLQDANYTILPRYWVPKSEVDNRLEGRWNKNWLLGYRWIGRSTDERTLISNVFMRSGVGNSLPILFSKRSPHILFSILQTLVLDYFARQFVGGANITFGIMKQIPVLTPEQVADFPFLNHVLELTYTAWDVQSFAKDCGYDGPPFKWDEERRAQMRCELDAYFFHKYLGDKHNWKENACDELKGHFDTPRDAVEYMMETFPIVKRRDEEKFGDYRTKLMILDIFDDMQEAMEKGEIYQTILNPPPCDPSMAHTESCEKR